MVSHLNKVASSGWNRDVGVKKLWISVVMQHQKHYGRIHDKQLTYEKTMSRTATWNYDTDWLLRPAGRPVLKKRNHRIFKTSLRWTLYNKLEDVRITNTFCKFSRTSHVEETFLVRTNSNNVWCRSQLIYCNQLREHCVTENVPWDLIGASVVITHCY